MSRSIHKTIKGVFGGKSAEEMQDMLNEDDSDVEELGKKYRYKTKKRNLRHARKLIKHHEED